MKQLQFATQKEAPGGDLLWTRIETPRWCYVYVEHLCYVYVMFMFAILMVCDCSLFVCKLSCCFQENLSITIGEVQKPTRTFATCTSEASSFFNVRFGSIQYHHLPRLVQFCFIYFYFLPAWSPFSVNWIETPVGGAAVGGNWSRKASGRFGDQRRLDPPGKVASQELKTKISI